MQALAARIGSWEFVVRAVVSWLLLGVATPAVAQDLRVLFPRGPSITVPYTGAGIDDYELVFSAMAAEAVDGATLLLSVTAVQGSGFSVVPQSGVTPSAYLALHPTVTAVETTVTIPAADS